MGEQLREPIEKQSGDETACKVEHQQASGSEPMCVLLELSVFPIISAHQGRERTATLNGLSSNPSPSSDPIAYLSMGRF